MKIKNYTPIETNNINLTYGDVITQIDASYNSIIIHGDNQNLTVSIAQELGDDHDDLAIDSMQKLFEIELDEEESDIFHNHEDVYYNSQLHGNAVILNVYDCFEFSKEIVCYLIGKGVNVAMEKILANESIY